MATSTFPTTQYRASNYIESAGTVLFRRSTATLQIALLHHRAKNQYLLPKGRRNVSESRADAAIRETAEETGLRCRLLPVTLATRAPPAHNPSDCPDEVRIVDGVCEPFMMALRELNLKEGKGVKVIWWYVAEVDEGGIMGAAEDKFGVEVCGVEDAVEKLTFEGDREVVREAILLYRRSYGE